jgi:hypothetical protein
MLVQTLESVRDRTGSATANCTFARLTYEHVKAAANSSDAAFDAIRRLLNVMLSGKLPHLPELLDATLVAFDMPSGGVRPIAIGEVWYRLASLCGLAGAQTLLAHSRRCSSASAPAAAAKASGTPLPRR